MPPASAAIAWFIGARDGPINPATTAPAAGVGGDLNPITVGEV
jgi:hypothetical protein